MTCESLQIKAIIKSCILRTISVDNHFSAEFKGVLLILRKKYSIKIIHGRAKHPPSQELVEQANGVVKTNLYCWLADHECKGWSDILPDITLRMNRQTYSAIVTGALKYPRNNMSK